MHQELVNQIILNEDQSELVYKCSTSVDDNKFHVGIGCNEDCIPHTGVDFEVQQRHNIESKNLEIMNYWLDDDEEDTVPYGTCEKQTPSNGLNESDTFHNTFISETIAVNKDYPNVTHVPTDESSEGSSSIACESIQDIKVNFSQVIVKKEIKPRMNISNGKFIVGDVVIGKFQSYGWWFGKVINHHEKLDPGHIWVYWYGDHKIIQFQKRLLYGCSMFANVYSPSKVKKRLYKIAVTEFLKSVYEFVGGIQMKTPCQSKKNYFSHLVDWGMHGFPVIKEHVVLDPLKKLSGYPNTSSTQIKDGETDHSVKVGTCTPKPLVMKQNHKLEKMLTENERFLCDVQLKRLSFSKAASTFSKATKPRLYKKAVHVTNSCQPSVEHNGESVVLSLQPLQSLPQVDSYSPERAPSHVSNTAGVSDSSGDLGDISDLSSSVGDSSVIKTKCKVGGISLNYDLLYTLSPKRKCFVDAAEKFVPCKKDRKRLHANVKENADPCNQVEHQRFVKKGRPRKIKHLINQTEEVFKTPVELYQPTLQTAQTDFKYGDLIIGKMKGFDWWFGKLVHHRKVSQPPSENGHFWVRWFGDHKISLMKAENLEDMSTFNHRFLPKKMTQVYRKAVYEILNEAAERSGKVDLPDTETDGGNEGRFHVLLEWSRTGFQPMGVDGFASNSDDIDESENEAEQSPEEQKLPFKDRCGKLIVSPDLSNEVKQLFDRVCDGDYDIDKLCLACGDKKVVTKHPLFHGGLCKECTDSFMECAYLYDTDGSQMYCSICSDGDEVILCDQLGCCRSYCPVCIDMLCGIGYAEEIAAKAFWHCFMCTGESVRILKRRDDWQEKLKALFQENVKNIDFGPAIFYDPVPFSDRKAIRVLALFDGIGTGFHVLNQLDLDIEIYIASEIDENAMKVTQVKHQNKVKHVGNICRITKNHVSEWGPFDLVIGGSPCNDLSIANPSRRGIYEGTGRLFFEFYRLLEYAKPVPVESRPFFWLFENVVGMRHSDKEVISRFLQCHPVVISAKDVSAQHRTRYFWGNLPGMNRTVCPLPGDRLHLQNCLEANCGRVAKCEKVRCITTNASSLRQTTKQILPVELTSSISEVMEDGLWVTEIERIFGFPEHYTDVANMGLRHRQTLLGKAWSVPVIRHLLSPLKDYFKKKDTIPEEFSGIE